MPPVSVIVMVPERAMFTCVAEGFPLSSISWRRINNNGSETVLMEEWNVTISSITISSFTLSPTDITLNGNYSCVATNSLGSDQAGVSLTVNGEDGCVDCCAVITLHIV